jgi:putative transposase
VDTMLKNALKRLKPTQRPLLHSDQGWHYQMPAFRRTLGAYGLEQSMSRKGNCLDNALMENFFGILKTEFFHRQRFESVTCFIKELKAYLRYYNHDRIKLKLKGLSPVEYRIQSSN